MGTMMTRKTWLTGHGTPTGHVGQAKLKITNTSFFNQREKRFRANFRSGFAFHMGFLFGFNLNGRRHRCAHHADRPTIESHDVTLLLHTPQLLQNTSLNSEKR